MLQLLPVSLRGLALSGLLASLAATSPSPAPGPSVGAHASPAVEPRLGSASAAITARWIATVAQSIQRGEYFYGLVEGGVYSAPNRALELRSRVSADGMEFLPRRAPARGAQAEWRLRTRTTGMTLGAETIVFGDPRLAHHEDRIELAHGPLTEWLFNAEHGLEQGWTLHQRRSAPGSREAVQLEIALGGELVAVPSADGRSVRFADANGEARLRYRELSALDAAGVELEARFSNGPGGLRIRFDDRSATYPVTLRTRLTGVWMAHSDQSAALFGTSVASAGDVDGDGFDDLLVGAPAYDQGSQDEGRVFLFAGSWGGLSTEPIWSVAGGVGGARFGASLAGGGDVDGDGLADFVIGSDMFDAGQGAEGRVFLFLGSRSGLSVSPAWTCGIGQPGARFGASLALDGDLNGDGLDDLVVGAPGFGGARAGAVFVYLGSRGELGETPALALAGAQPGASFGAALSASGDVNGDGLDDLLVGAPGFDGAQRDAGRVSLFLGAARGVSDTPLWSADGTSPGARLGAAVALVDDVNDDGFDDVLLGAPGHTGSEVGEGAAQVYLGSALGLPSAPDWEIEGEQAGAQLGRSVSSAGDADGDGFADIAVGAPGRDSARGESAAGQVLVFEGSPTGLRLDPARTLEGHERGARFGSSLAVAGDVNRDGQPDLAVGALWFDEFAPRGGRAHVFEAFGAAGTRVTQDLQVLYGFGEGSGSIVQDVSGVGAPLDLSIGNVSNVSWVPGGGLQVLSPTVISSGAPASKVIAAVKGSQEITLEAWIVPASASYPTEVRVATISQDGFPNGGNTSLTQRVNYGWRLRTSATNQYGQPELNGPAGALPLALSHVVYTRDAAGQRRMYLDGVPIASDTRLGSMATAWNDNYPLTLANEPTGDRSWLGTLHLVAIYSRALTQAEVDQNLAAGPGVVVGPIAPSITAHPQDRTVVEGQTAQFSVSASGTEPLAYQWQRLDASAPMGFEDIPGAASATLITAAAVLADDGDQFRCVVSNGIAPDATSNAATLGVQVAGARVTQDLQVLYGFGEGSGSVVQDISGVGAPLNLSIANVSNVSWIPGGGLEVVTPTVINSGAPAAKVNSAVKASGEITLEAWIAPTVATYPTEARIVAVSQDGFPNGANTCLTQKTEYGWRLRTSVTNQYGQRELSGPGGSLVQALSHVVCTRDAAGQRRMYIDGVQVAADTRLGSMASAWNDAYTLTLANEPPGDRAWRGRLHLVALYSRALTPTEVDQNFDAGPGVVVAPSAPSIDVQPQDRTVAEGLTAEFSVSASGSEPLAYQWQRLDASAPMGFEDIVGAMSATYVTAATVLADDGDQFRCVVSNGVAPDAVSDPATLTVQAGGQRVTQDLQVLYGFGEGAGSLVQDVSGVGAPLDLTIANPSNVNWLAGGGLEVVVPTVINSGAPATKVIDAVKASEEISLEAWLIPRMVQYPTETRIVAISQDGSPNGANTCMTQKTQYGWRLRTSATNQYGQPELNGPAAPLPLALSHVVYTRDAAGQRRLYVDGVQVAMDSRLGSIASAWNNAYTLTLANEPPGDRSWLGTLRLVAIYSRSLTPAEVVMNYDAGPDLVPTAPTIVTQPADRTVGAGQSASLTVGAIGSHPLAYQWQRFDTGSMQWDDLLGQNGNVFTSAPLSLADDGAMFRCVVSNGIPPDAVSDAATVSVVEVGDTFRFAAIGDFGDASPAEAAVANLVAALNPDFVITTGDNNYNTGSAATIDANVGQFYRNFIGAYTGSYPGIEPPFNRFFPSLGNHDWDNGDLLPYTNYFTLPGAGIATSNSSGNERYYDFLQGPIHFFVVDSDGREPDGNSPTSTQGMWLQAQLAASSARWKMVVFHHPAFSSSTNHGSQAFMQWPFEAWGADAVFSGHDHTYERILRDDNGDGETIPYFVTGLGGRSLYGFPNSGFVGGSQARYNADYGTMIVEANELGVTYQFFSVSDGLVDSYTVGASPSGLAPGAVIVAGFQATNDPTGQDPGEFVTLFNTTGSAISLAGLDLISRVDTGPDGALDVDWRLSDESPDLAGKFIAPYGFFLIGESGVAGDGGTVDLVANLDLATGEGGAAERAIGIEVVIDLVHMDHVLYGRGDGSDTAGQPPGDLPFDGVSFPRDEVIRNTLGTGNFVEGVCRRLSASDLFAGFDAPGFYTDEGALGAGNPAGVWTSPHDSTDGSYTARSSATPAVLPPATDPPDGDPTGLTATALPSSFIELAWSDNSSNESVFMIERKLGMVGTFAPLVNVAAGSQSYVDSSVSGSTEYCYRVKASNSLGDSAYTNEACATTTQAPITATFRQGLAAYAGTQDTYFQEAAPAAINGANADWEWDDDDPNGSGQVNLGLLRFDAVFGAGAGQIPSGSTIASATVSYTVFDVGVSGDVREMLVAWDESSSLTGVCGASCAEGVVYGATSVATAVASSTGSFAIDVTASLQAWSIDPSSNRGWMFLPSASGTGGGAQIRSSEYATAVQRPTLTVQFVPPAPTAPPLAPSGLMASAASSSSILLEWTDNSTNEDVFEIERDGPGGITLFQVPLNTVSYLDTMLASGAQYCYRILARNAVGDSAFTEPAVCATTSVALPGDVIVAGFQSWNDPAGQNPGEFISLFNTTDRTISLENLEIVARTDNDASGTLDVDWQLSDEMPNLVGKVIEPYSFFLIAESGVAAPNGVHDVEVSMDLATGEGGSAERAIGIEVLIDGAHMDHVLYGRHDGSDTGANPDGDIAFDGVTFPRNEVIRNTRGTGSFQEGVLRRLSQSDLFAGHAVAGFYADENLLGAGNPNGVWTSPHDQTDGAYQARNSDSPVVLPPGGGGPPDGSPTGLTATAVSATQIDLAWSDNASNEDAYEVERSENGGLSFGSPVVLPADAMTYSDPSVSPGTEYCYRVRASNASGFSSYTGVRCAVTPGFVAYNDFNVLAADANAVNVTKHDYQAVGVALKDFGSGADLAITLTGSTTGTYDPINGANGAQGAVGTDAAAAFGAPGSAIVDLQGPIELDTTADTVGLTLDNLDPSKEYAVTLTANRDNTAYTGRWTRVTIQGADAFVNESSSGVSVADPGNFATQASVSFNSGNNTANGHVARWTGIRSGADGSISILSEREDGFGASGTEKGYAMTALKFEELAGSTSGVSTRFAVFGDYGFAGPDIAAVANLIENTLNPDLIVTTGDNSYGSTSVDDNIGQYYSDWIGAYSGAYGMGATTNKFFPSLGNHDYTDGAGLAAYLAYFTLPGAGIPSTNSSGNERYYDFVQGPVHFFIVNSNSQETDGNSSTSAQAAWLQAQLAASTAPWKLVFMHHPPYSSATTHGNEVVMQWPYEAWGADAVLAGHDHTYERIHKDDNSDGKTILYFVTGLGGRSVRGFGATFEPGSQVGYGNPPGPADFGTMLVSATETSILYEFYSVNATHGVGGRIDSYLVEKATTGLAAPSGLVATATTSNQLALTWSDNSSGETGFELERSLSGAAGTFLPLATLPANAEAFVDTGLLSDTEYCYRVRAVNGTVSAYSDVTCQTTTPLVGAPGEDFTIVVLPDTQFYAEDDSQGIFSIQTQWIADQASALNIAYVGHVGDCVQNGNVQAEWNVADAAFRIIEDPIATGRSDGAPYGICVGNHDQSPAGNPDGTSTTFYNQTFGESRFLGRPYYGGHYGSNNDNHYDLFEAGGLEFVAVYFEYDETQDQAVLDWADGVLAAHVGRRAIVLSHYLTEVGEGGAFGTQGQAIYDALKDNPNLFLMLSGHRSGEGKRVDVFNGSTVHTLVADYQSRPPSGGEGWLRYLTFSPSTNQIHVYTYSPFLGQSETDADSQFTLTYDMGGTAPSMQTFQPGVNGEVLDNILESGVGSNGALEEVVWDTSPLKYGLLQFVGLFGSGPGQIPPGSTIHSAVLTYVVHDDSTSPPATVNEVAVDWDESTTFADFGGEADVQADEYGAAVGTASAATPLGAKQLDVTASLVGWSLDRLSNRGWIFRPNGTSGGGFRSSEYGVLAERPRLDVSFTPPVPGVAPSAPGGLTAVAGAGVINVAWIDNSNDEDSFELQRSESGGPFLPLVSGLPADSTDHVDATVAPGIEYCYEVRAVNLAGASAYSAADCATVSAMGPDAPSDLAAAVSGPDEAALSWSDNSSDETSFEVERSVGGGPFAGLATLPADTLAYLDATAVAGSEYCYRVKAVNGGGDSAFSNSACVPPFGLSFDGVNQYVTFGAAPGLGLSEFTLELWFKRTGAGQGVSTGGGGLSSAIPLLTKGRGEGDGSNVDMNYFFGIDVATGVLVADFEDTNSAPNPNNHPIFGVTPIANDLWYHAAATYDGDTWSLYLNGIPENSESEAGATPRSDSIQHAGIGSAMTSTGAAQGFFQGQVDEVRIWSAARSELEIVAAAREEVVAATDLVARFGLNQGQGASALNSVAGGVAGTLTNSPTWVAGAPFEFAFGLSFDGVDDRVTFGAAPALGLATFTVELWFMRSGPGVGVTTGGGGLVSAVPLVTKGRGEGDGSNVDMNYFLGIDVATGVLVADFEDTTSAPSPNNHPVFGVTPIATGTWYHAAASYDGDAWRLYLDGAPELGPGGESEAGATPRFDSIQHAGLGTAMTSTGAAAGFFQGVLDEVRIWDVARSDVQIADGRDLEIDAGPGLVARWGLNEGAGTVVVSAAIDGSSIGGTTWSAGSPFAVQLVAEFQRGSNGTVLDNILESGMAAQGALEEVVWDTSPLKYGLLAFPDLFGAGAGQVPAGATIHSAVLTYVVHDDSTSPAATVNEVLVDWNEATTYALFGGTDGVQVAEYGAEVGAASAATPLGAKTLDVTSSVAAWSSDPAANRGWIFRPNGTSGGGFRSSEYGVAAERPRLVVTYSPAP